MNRSRIRVRNLSRLVAVVAGGSALLVLVPGLLGKPEAPPLPDDVGLDAGAIGPVAAPPPTGRRMPPGRSRSRRSDAKRSGENRRRPADEPGGRRNTGSERHGEPPRPGNGHSPMPATAQLNPHADPSHRPPAPPPAASPPAATPPSAPPEPSPGRDSAASREPQQTGEDAETSGPSEFGFER
jgi:hypothetical protein